MFGTLRTLIKGADARAEAQLRDVYAIELIDQKIRETEGQVRAAKATLASLIQRTRSEQRLKAALDARITTLTQRASEALEAGQTDMANDAATAIAEMENEANLRSATIDRLKAQTTRLQTSVERGHRRVIDLKQGAITARAMRQEQKIQARLHTTLGGVSAADEAQELIDRVVGTDDPLEQADILQEINAGLDQSGLDDRMAAAGFGPATKTTAADVLARLTK